MKQGEIWIWVSSPFYLFYFFYCLFCFENFWTLYLHFPHEACFKLSLWYLTPAQTFFLFFFFFFFPFLFPIRRWQKTACPEYLVNVRHCLVIIRITLASALWADRGGSVIVDRLCVVFYVFLNAGVWKGGQQQLAGKLLWSVRAVELWSSRANQRKTKAHNSRGLHSCWSAFNANRAYFHTPLIAWIDCLLNS